MTVDFVVHGRAIRMYLPDGDDPVQEKIRNRRGFSEAELARVAALLAIVIDYEPLAPLLDME